MYWPVLPRDGERCTTTSGKISMFYTRIQEDLQLSRGIESSNCSFELRKILFTDGESIKKQDNVRVLF